MSGATNEVGAPETGFAVLRTSPDAPGRRPLPGTWTRGHRSEVPYHLVLQSERTVIVPVSQPQEHQPNARAEPRRSRFHRSIRLLARPSPLNASP